MTDSLQLCPLCGAPNNCALAQPESIDAECWCRSVAIDPAALERIAPADRGRRCLCERCGRSDREARAARA